MRFFLLFIVSAGVFFYISLQKDWVVITPKGHKQIKSVNGFTSNVLEKTSSVIDSIVGGVDIEVVDKAKKKLNESKKQVRDTQVKVKDKTSGVFYRVLDKFYEIYNDLFGDPIAYRNSKK